MSLGLTHSALGLEHTFPPEQLQPLPLESQLPRCPPSPTCPPHPRSEPSMGCKQGPAGAAWHGGDAACSQEAPCPRAGLVAGLTVSTLPAVSSMELALTASRVMSERMSSSPTMPL